MEAEITPEEQASYVTWATRATPNVHVPQATATNNGESSQSEGAVGGANGQNRGPR